MIRLVLPDLHVPFHDEALFELWLHHLTELRPDGVDIIGDLLDCYTLSRFSRDPSRKITFQEEVDQAQRLLTTIREKAGESCDIRYSEGNHESRLRKVLWGKLPELADVRGLTIPKLLGLEGLGIKWHSTQNPYRIHNLWYSHGDLLRKHAGASARAKSDDIHASILVGHTHRTGWSPRTTWEGIEDAYEVGHLSDYTQLDYVHTPPNWQQGWAEVRFLPGGIHDVGFIRVRGTSKKQVLIHRGEIVAKLGLPKGHLT